MQNTNKYEKAHILMRAEHDKLRDEINELKRCQIDFIKLGTIVFGLVVSVISALTPHLQIFNENLKPVNLILYLCMLSIIVIVHPYIMWIIIHKCRSIFRIIAYIRILEELSIKGGYYYGYETLYRKLKQHPWLSVRVSDRLFIRVLRDARSYKHWINMVGENYSDDTLISMNGIKEKRLYIGDYYGKILFFIKLLWFIGCLGSIALSFYGVYKFQGFWPWIFGCAGIFFILWVTYHLLLT